MGLDITVLEGPLATLWEPEAWITYPEIIAYKVV